MDGIADFTTDTQAVDHDYQQYKLTNCEYTTHNGQTTVHLIGRESNGNRVHFEVTGHNPSFFVPEDECANRTENHYSVAYTEPNHTSLMGEQLRRIYTNTPDSIRDFKEQFSETWEADVFYTTRFLIDKDIWVGFEVDMGSADANAAYQGDYRVSHTDVRGCDAPTVDSRLCVVDIEIGGEGEVPDTNEADAPVTSIAAFDSYDGEYVGWLLESPQHDTEALQGVSDTDFETRIFDNESSMLDNFNEYIEQRRPDLLSGWFSDDFDYPYLINRCKNLNVYSYRDWSPFGEVWVNKRFGDTRVKGVSMFDGLESYKKVQIHKLQSKKLEDIAQTELGVGKLDKDGLSYTELWEQKPEKHLRYNKVDVQRVVEIIEAQSLIELFDQLRSVTGAQYSDCYAAINMIDVLTLREATDRGFRLPTSTAPDTDWYYGGHVVKPTAGLHEHVVYPDYASLYPSLLQQLNISPETIVGTEDELEASEYTEDDCVWSYIDTRPEEHKKESSPDAERCYYLKPSVKEGFVSDMVEKIMVLTRTSSGKRREALKRIRNACFTPDTEVLTPNGIRNITDVEVGDMVYSLNPETGEMEQKPVTEVIEKPEYDGELVHIESESIDLKMTPNHRVMNRRYRVSDEWEITQAGDLNKWTQYQLPHDWNFNHGDGIERIDIAKYLPDEYLVTEDTVQKGSRHNTFQRYIDGDTFIELLGWFITEGSVKTPDIHGDRIQISQSKEVHPDEHERIVECLQSLDCHVQVRDMNISISGSTYVDLFTELCGRGSKNMKIPEVIFEDASLEQKELFIEVLMFGDGTISENRYKTISEQLRDDFIRLLWECNYSPTYRKVTHDNEKWNDIWIINYSEEGDYNYRNNFRMHLNGSTETATDGVYCVQVADNHMLVAGRNGKFVNILNCYGVFGDSASFGNGFRLYDWRLAESTTLGAQQVLLDGADYFIEEANKDTYNQYRDSSEPCEVVGGDTDSVVSTLPAAKSSEDALNWAMEVTEATNEWLPQHSKETFNVEPENCTMELDLETYSTKLFFVAKNPSKGQGSEGVKKRYASAVAWEEGEWYDEPEIQVKGFEYVRSDVAPVTRDVQYEVLTSILSKSLSEAMDESYELINDVVGQIQTNEYPLSDVGVPFGIGQELHKYGSPERRPQPQYRGAKYANTNIYGGDAIDTQSDAILFYVSRVGGEYPKTYTAETAEDGTMVDAISVLDAADVPTEISIDGEKMASKVVEKPLKPIFGTLGWDYDEALRDGEQSTLASSFM